MKFIRFIYGVGQVASRAAKRATRSASLAAALASVTMLSSGQAMAFGDQWYVGIAGGSSWLQPNPEQPGLGLSSRLGNGGSLMIGRDVDNRSSAQLQFYSLGEAELENGEFVPFYAADASIVYRLYDSRDASIRRGGLALAVYGRFALGFLERDTQVPLSDDSSVYFGGGGGVEVFFNDTLSLRAEGMYHDVDASSASLALVARFGGVRRHATQTPVVPTPPTQSLPTPGDNENQDSATQSNSDALPVPAPVPVPAPEPSVALPSTASAADADGDGVEDALDRCPDSRANYPVRATGCALFDGVLSGVSFLPGTGTLTADAYAQLDYLANVLTQYPLAKVELLAHADDTGTVRDQAILTRARLRAVGTYLVQRGVKSNRLVLRSFGGTRPLYDNSTPAGKEANNRIEVIEYRAK